MDELFDLVAEALKVDRESVTDATGPLNESQWDSFRHVHLVMAVEEKYGVEMSPQEIVGLLSVGDIAALLRSKGVEPV
jgi:acyl carrier protein